MTSRADDKALASAIALPDLTEIEVADAFYLLRKINPLNLMVTDFHGPRKYYAKYDKSKRSYKKYLPIIEEQEIAWKDFIFESALNMVFCDTERKLIAMKSKCVAKKIILPQNVFSWSIKDSIHRLDLPNDLYIDLIELNYESDDLDQLKLQLDVTQILEIYNRIASEFMDNVDLHKELIPTLKAYIKRDEYQKKLNIQCAFNTNEYQRLMEMYNRNLLFPPAKLKEELLPRLARLQLINMESEASIPIHDRYKVNWFRTNTFFKLLNNSKYLQKTKQKIDELYATKNGEEECLETKLSVYDNQLTTYMGEYDRLMEKYDIDYEDADNEVAIIRSKINKAKDDLKFCKDQAVFFKKSVKETLATIKREKLEEQLRLDLASTAPTKKRRSKPKKNKK